MSDLILEKLDREWKGAIRSRDYVLAGKILRAKINVLKSSGNLAEHKEALSAWTKTLEERVGDLASEVSLTVIGHLRHARKALSLTGSDVGSAFRSPISEKDRAKYRKRNRPPDLGVPDRSELPANFANGSPSLYLRAGMLGKRTE